MARRLTVVAGEMAGERSGTGDVGTSDRGSSARWWRRWGKPQQWVSVGAVETTVDLIAPPLMMSRAATLMGEREDEGERWGRGRRRALPTSLTLARRRAGRQ